MNTTTAQRLTFQPAAGHPGGKYARPASLPAGHPVTAEPLENGRYLLRADVDGTQDYELETTADALEHPAWCNPGHCITDPTDGTRIHSAGTDVTEHGSYTISATLTDDGTGPRVSLDAAADAATLEELDALIGELQLLRRHYH